MTCLFFSCAGDYPPGRARNTREQTVRLDAARHRVFSCRGRSAYPPRNPTFGAPRPAPTYVYRGGSGIRACGPGLRRAYRAARRLRPGPFPHSGRGDNSFLPSCPRQLCAKHTAGTTAGTQTRFNQAAVAHQTPGTDTHRVWVPACALAPLRRPRRGHDGLLWRSPHGPNWRGPLWARSDDPRTSESRLELRQLIDRIADSRMEAGTVEVGRPLSKATMSA